jgi:hypothetical protein
MFSRFSLLPIQRQVSSGRALRHADAELLAEAKERVKKAKSFYP